LRYSIFNIGALYFDPKVTCHITRQVSNTRLGSVANINSQTKQSSKQLWLMRVWVRIPFAAIFADISRG